MTLSRKALLLLLAPAMLAACSVRQLNDGSYTTCHVGNSCQVGPQGAMKTSGPMLHTPHHHHHVVVKKAGQPAHVVTKTTHTVPAKPSRTDDSINAK